MSKSDAKKRIATVWFTGAGFLFLIIVVQSILGRYGPDATPAWSWFLPTVMPVVSLIIGVLISDVAGWSQSNVTINPYVFRLAFWMSIGYLVVVAMTIFLAPFSSDEPVALMVKSNLWLGPAQGLVSASIGVFFVGKSIEGDKS